MPGDPQSSLSLNAARYLELSKRAKNRTRRANLAAHRQRCGRKLAAEFEADQPLLNTLSELELDQPFYAVPEALNLRAA